MKAPSRGEVWLIDMGYTGKTRPAIVFSAAPTDQERALVTVVPHTTSVRGTKYEVAISANYLKPGAFDAQGIAPVPLAKLLRPLGVLRPADLIVIENSVRAWLSL